MPREATITFEQVVNIAEAIKASGGRPTSRAIRERHGTGSLGTIQKLLQRWDLGQAHQLQTTLSLPPTLQRAVLDFVGAEIADGRSELERRLSDAQQAIQDLADENERQAEELEALRRDISSTENDRSALEGRLAQLAVDLSAARAEVSQERSFAESARTELAKAYLRLETMPRLEAEMETVREEIRLERAQRIAAERSVAGLDAKSEGLEARLADTVEAFKASLANMEAQLLDQRKRSSEVINKLEGDKIRLDNDLRECRKEAKAAIIEGSKLTGQVEALRAQLAEANEANNER